MSSISPIAATLNVALGGAMGSVLRYQLGRGITHWLGPHTVTQFPWATLTVNILGSMAMGVLAGWQARHGGAGNEAMRLLIGIGLLGGFTTFSSFSLEMVLLIRRGDIALGLIYSGVSVLAGFCGLYLGLLMMRMT